MRLIDANALKESIEKYRTVHLSHRRLSAIRREAEEVINDIRFAIDVASTIDPVKRGRWIIRDNPGTEWYRVTCSECGEDVTSTIQVIGFFPDAKPLWDFCPWCGARMEGDEDE